MLKKWNDESQFEDDQVADALVGTAGDIKVPADAPSDEPEDLTQLDWEELRRRTDVYDRVAISELQRRLDERPEIWRAHGDLGIAAERELIGQLTDGDSLQTTSVLRMCDALRTELIQEPASPLQRLAIQRVVLLSLETNLLRKRLAGATDAPSISVIARTKAQSERTYELAMKSLLSIQEKERKVKTAKPKQTAK